MNSPSFDSSEMILKKLSDHSGVYVGEGLSQKREEITGRLQMVPILGGAGVEITFMVNEEGSDSVSHSERTLIAPKETGSLALWTISTQDPQMLHHELKTNQAPQGSPEEKADLHLAFLFQDPKDQKGFHQEIHLEIWPNGDFSYGVFRGKSGEDLMPQFGVRLNKLKRG